MALTRLLFLSAGAAYHAPRKAQSVQRSWGHVAGGAERAPQHGISFCDCNCFRPRVQTGKPPISLGDGGFPDIIC